MRASLRAFAGLVVAGMIPLIAFGAVLAFGGELARQLGSGTLLLTVVLLGVIAAAMLAPIVARWIADEPKLASAEHRGDEPAHQATLAERDRQIQELARQVQLAPIGGDMPTLARHVVAAAQSVTGDRTWSLAVVGSGIPSLPAGWYGAEDAEGGPIEELHRWAAASGRPSEADESRCRMSDGPWGAFAIIDVQADDTLRAILLAPWAGRAEPRSAEIGMLTLIGEHAAVAMEHAILYGRLRDQTQELDRLTAIQGDFLRGVTHDLQSPLTSIGALAAELSAHGGLSDAARTDLDGIAFQAGRLRRLVAQLLTVTGLDAQAITPREEVFRLEPIIRRVWASLRSDRPFSVAVSGPDRLVTGDPDRLEQVVWALLDNALKYSAPGSPITAHLKAERGPDGALVEEMRIRDLGIGMDAETLERAFDRFFRASGARDVAPDGSGVGLYTAAGLVKLMNGRLSAESALGQGTTMIVRLPAEAAQASVDAGSGSTKVLPNA